MLHKQTARQAGCLSTPAPLNQPIRSVMHPYMHTGMNTHPFLPSRQLLLCLLEFLLQLLSLCSMCLLRCLVCGLLLPQLLLSGLQKLSLLLKLLCQAFTRLCRQHTTCKQRQ